MDTRRQALTSAVASTFIAVRRSPSSIVTREPNRNYWAGLHKWWSRYPDRRHALAGLSCCVHKFGDLRLRARDVVYVVEAGGVVYYLGRPLVSLLLSIGLRVRGSAVNRRPLAVIRSCTTSTP